jgi:hypothetical protein
VTSVSSLRRLRQGLGIALLTTMWIGTSAAQDNQTSDSFFAHPLIFGPDGGGSSGTEAEIRDLRILFHVPIIPLEDRKWGLRLRVTLYAGVYDVDIFDAIDPTSLQFQSLGATPGVELLLPVGGGWTLKPFVDLGYARDFDSDVDFLLWSAGMRTLAIYGIGKFDLSLGTKFEFLSVHTSKLDLEDRFGEFLVGLDALHPLPFKIAGNQADVSGYYIYRHYIDARVNREEGEPLTLESSHEIGVTFGTDPKIKLWFMRLPRIGLGYRFGPNIRGVRLNFGFPF